MILVHKVIVHFDQIEQFKGNDTNGRPIVRRTIRGTASRQGLSQTLKGSLSSFGGLITYGIFLARHEKFLELGARSLLDGQDGFFVLNVPPTVRLASHRVTWCGFVFDAHTPMVTLGTKVTQPMQGTAISAR